MQQRTRAWLASGFVGVVFLLVQVGALALVPSFDAAGYQAVEDPQDPTNSLLYLGAILVVTALMLVIIKLDLERLIRAFIVFASVYLAWFVFSVVVPPVAVYAGVNLLAVAASLVLGAALYAYPEWYVIDAAGVVMGAGAAGLFGISFGLLPAILLLVVLAVYDAISVYGTEHMLELASGVMDFKLPIILVVPLTLSYSFLEAEAPEPTGEVDEETAAEAAGDGAAVDGGDPETVSATDVDGDDSDGDTEPPEGKPFERDAMFVGLGDAVIPTVLVASAAFFAPADAATIGLAGATLPLTVVGAMVGTLVGLALLLRMVFAGRAHAGLPLLNGGSILGYLAGALAAGVPLLQALGLAQYL